MADRLTEEIRRIKKLRKALGWSQETMAQEIGVTLSTYGRWEHGQSKPRSEVMIDRLRAFLKKHKG